MSQAVAEREYRMVWKGKQSAALLDTIRELDIAAATGVQVILLRKHRAGGEAEVRVAAGDDRIDEGDRLVVAGTRAAVESLDSI